MTWAALGALVAVAAAARFFRLGLPALSSDEAFSWRLAGYPVGEIVRLLFLRHLVERGDLGS